MILPVYDWSGFYVGINGGGGSSRNCWDFVGAAGVLTSEGCDNATGGTVGGLFGYRWQSTSWVFGVEAQANWADFSGDNISTLIPAQQNRSGIDAFGLFTGQDTISSPPRSKQRSTEPAETLHVNDVADAIPWPRIPDAEARAGALQEGVIIRIQIVDL